jgi:hypothetical protein
MRAGTVTGKTIGMWAGWIDGPVPPQDYFFVPSSKGDRRILVNVHRNQAALKNLDKPSAVHFNWHGMFPHLFLKGHVILLSPVTWLLVTYLLYFVQVPGGFYLPWAKTAS